MSDYDYGNPRVRAMKSRLLSREQLESLAKSKNISSLITALSETTYQKSLEAAMAIAEGMHIVEETLRLDLIETMKKIRQYYSGQAGEFLHLWMQRYDLHNLKTILRGLSQNFLPDEILPLMLPIGNIPESVLKRMTKVDTPRAVVDLAATLGLPYAQPLMKMRVEKPGAPIAELELALEKWYFQTAKGILKKVPPESADLREALHLEADIANLMTVLRFVRFPEARRRIGKELQNLLIGYGQLSFELLEKTSNQENIEAAAALLKDTYLTDSIQSGLEAFQKSGRLSEFELALLQHKLHWIAGSIVKKPLGISVPLGYIALKLNEISNLRWIARGIELSLNQKQIISNLEFIE